MKKSMMAVIAVAIAAIIVVGAYAVISMNQTSTNSTTNVNIGYFANVNHAPMILSVWSGNLQNALGPSTTFKTFLFTSGGPEMTALLAGRIDIGVVGPGPAVNAYIQSKEAGLVVLAGVTSGGAVFVVRNNDGITPNDSATLVGKTIAAPGLGNTQDIALRYYLMEHHLVTGTGGNVTVDDTTNANIVTLFAQNKIDGAWVPEPYGEVLMQQYGGKLFLDERSLWTNGAFSTAELVVTPQFLQQHPDVVKDVVSALVGEINWINANPSKAETDLNTSMITLTGQGYSSSVLSASLSRMSFTYDPIATSVQIQAQHAYALGDLTSNPESLLGGLYNLTILNSVLSSDGLSTVQS
jgi:NitT/TauT family transport system substrate-binding protein